MWGEVMGEATARRRGRLASTGALLLAGTVALGGCGGLQNPLAGDDAPEAAAPAPTVANLEPDSRGVITYASYQVAVARDGDTLATVASRVGATASELARRNALPEDYLLRPGEVVLLPDSVPRPAAGLAGDSIAAAPLPDSVTAAVGAPADNPFQNGQSEPLIDPVRHRVEPGETAYSIARLYGVSVTALASWNGLGPDLAVRENQELLIPIVSDANRIATGPADTEPGQGTAVGAPPSAAAPLPADITAAVVPESPDLGAQRTPPGGRLSAPVTGTVTRRYDAANPNGIGFAVPAGTAVKAAAPGEVALISEALGGLGTIVLVRHRDDLITTYSTLADVRVSEGEQVQAGQVLGVVAERDNPELQFDVFRGTTSVDPTPYIGGG
jgi:murein DD-endopeptidase MepM/ murein hydrolase activator NlpD